MRPVCLFAGALLVGTCLGLSAQETRLKDQTPSAATTAADEKAIADLVTAFGKAFNGGDATAAAATFAEDALVVDEFGERTLGRAAIRAGLAASFAGSPGSTIEIKVDSLRFLGPDTALEEGRTLITPAKSANYPRTLASPSSTSRKTANGSNPSSATRLTMT